MCGFTSPSALKKNFSKTNRRNKPIGSNKLIATSQSGQQARQNFLYPKGRSSRWGIEAFFKQIKQTLKVCDFLGHSKQAIRWQLWSALLLYVLLRFQAWASNWPHSFTRLFALLRGILWDRFDLRQILDFYGTASGRWRMCSHPETAYLPGFTP